jgi:hypothetical protein
MTFDLAMPLTLFFVTLVSLFLNQKTESKLKVTLDEKEFRTRDAVLLVAVMVVMISLIAFLRDIVAPLMILFMFSYSALLFMFTYVFTNRRWYLAIIPPIVFILSYVFLRDTSLWTLHLVNIYAVIFAILITLYIGSMFTWKSTLIFTALLTIVDIILVLITGTMIEAANAARGLSLPVMVTVPVIPLISMAEGIQFMSLGLGDFFFAGLVVTQSFKKYGKKFALLSAVSITVSFFIFEALLLTYRFAAFPGTLMIICGWLPLVAFKYLKKAPAS